MVPFGRIWAVSVCVYTEFVLLLQHLNKHTNRTPYVENATLFS